MRLALCFLLLPVCVNLRLIALSFLLLTAYCTLPAGFALRLALCCFRLAFGLGDDGEPMKTGGACLVHDPNHRTMGDLLVGLDENLRLIA